MNRRGFVYSLAASTLTGMSPAAVRAAIPSATRRVLWLRHEGDTQDVEAPFCIDGRSVYQPGYREICWVMRDRNVPTAEGYVRFDIVEIEALWEVQQTLALMGIREPLVITSGYRTEQTNAATEGSARNSMHVYAKAADFYVSGASTRQLFDACWSRSISGGMGYYGSHVHLDSGARRWWAADIPVPTSSVGDSASA